MNPRILVVDDSDFWLKVLRVRLTNLGYEVDTAGNVIEAFTKLKWRDYDFIILDYGLRHWNSDSIEEFMIKRNVAGCIFTGYPAGDVNSKLPVVEKCDKRGGFNALFDVISQQLSGDKQHAYA